MKVTILCSDKNHPINDFIYTWMDANKDIAEITLARKKNELPGGDVLFLISCHEIIKEKDRNLYQKSLVLHASDLPIGRGWSPHIWEIVNGAKNITLSLIEAEDEVDSGKIWFQTLITIPEHLIWNEINHLLFEAEIKVIESTINNFEDIQPSSQNTNIKPTYYRKRVPEDSIINPEKSIESQFNQIRICDPNRFPAFFNLHGHRYKIILEKDDE